MYTLIIDTETKGHKKIKSRLMRLKSTFYVQDNGAYIQCPECSQLELRTTKTEDEVDHWLWENNLDYIGVVTND